MRRLFDVFLSEDREHGAQLATRFSIQIDDADLKEDAREIWGSIPESGPSKVGASEEAKKKVCSFLRQQGELEALVHVRLRDDRRML